MFPDLIDAARYDLFILVVYQVKLFTQSDDGVPVCLHAEILPDRLCLKYTFSVKQNRSYTSFVHLGNLLFSIDSSMVFQTKHAQEDLLLHQSLGQLFVKARIKPNLGPASSDPDHTLNIWRYGLVGKANWVKVVRHPHL